MNRFRVADGRCAACCGPSLNPVSGRSRVICLCPGVSQDAETVVLVYETIQMVVARGQSARHDWQIDFVLECTGDGPYFTAELPVVSLSFARPFGRYVHCVISGFAASRGGEISRKL